MTASSGNSWTELEVQRLQYGGYVVLNPPVPGSGQFTPLLAAFSTLDEALVFIRDNLLVDAKTPL